MNIEVNALSGNKHIKKPPLTFTTIKYNITKSNFPTILLFFRYEL